MYNFPRHATFRFRSRNPSMHRIGGLFGPRASLDISEKRKISIPTIKPQLQQQVRQKQREICTKLHNNMSH